MNITLPMRPRTLRLFLASVGLGATLALGAAGVARADGYITQTEAAYILTNGGVVCTVISRYPSEAGVLGVMDAIVEDGFTYDDSVDVINASVDRYCPQWWGLLEAIGGKLRAENQGWRI